MIPIIIAIVYFGFFSVLFGIRSKRQKAKAAAEAGTQKDKEFFTAKGRLGWFTVMCCFVLAPLGGGHTTSLYEQQASMGAAVVWWSILAGGVFVPVFLLWFGPMFRKLKVETFPQALGKIFGPKIKIFNSSVAPAAWLGIAISELLGTSTAIYALCGGRIAYAPHCILIATALMLIYILFGGMLQASMMNVINAIILIGGSYVAVVCVGLNLEDGYAGITESYTLQGLAEQTNFLNLTPEIIVNVALPVVILHVLSVASEQAMYQPMLAAKTNKDIRRGAFLGGMFNTAAAIPWVVLGVTGTSFAAIASQEAILSVPSLALMMLPQYMIGILMVALLCALLSTGSGMILAISHVVSDDVVGPLVNKKPGDKGYEGMSRIIIVVITLAAVVPAMKVDSLMTLFFWCFALSMPIFVNYLIGMVWKINRKAAWINLFATTAVNFWWTFACPDWAGLFTLPFWPVMVVTIGLGIILNLIMPGEPGLLKQLEMQEKEAAK